MAVIKHCSIDNTLGILGKMLQILIVCSNNAISSSTIETVEQCLGNSTTYLRLGTTAKLVNKQQRALVAITHTLLHVRKVRAIGTQVVLDRLFIAYIYKDAIEYTHVRVVVHRYKQSALHHVLQKPHRFEAHRLSTCIGTRYEQYAIFIIEGYIQRNNILVLTAQCEQE